MLPTMARKPAIAIVGPGRLGSALARGLSRAGYTISEVVSRNSPASRRQAAALAKSVHAPSSPTVNAHLDAELIWFCVPDREIAAAAYDLAGAASWKGKIAIHSSGALASDELRVLRLRGAAVASVHPLMTFVRGSAPSLKGVPFALEGDAAAVRIGRKIVRRLGGEPFTLRKQDKVAYHAWGMFASPLLVALLTTTEQVAKLAGISASEARKKMLPIVRQTIANYASLGPEKALTGPLVRGDAEIVSKHIRMLKRMPEAKAVYAALVRSALLHLPARNRRELEKILKRLARS